jgi:hypothetical protein
MKTQTFLPLCLLLAGGLSASAQYVTGHWLMNEGTGSVLANSSASTTNWTMNLSGDPNLWGYWQPGAYTFAGGFGPNVNNFRTDLTSAAAWTPGDTLSLRADINVVADLHDTGTILKGGAVFGAGYWQPGGNGLGYNYGAFFASVDTRIPSAPLIKFGIAGIPPGEWSQPLPASITATNYKHGWNTVEWILHNNTAANSVTIRFRLNGTNVGSAVVVPDFYIHDFSDYVDYQGTKFYIGAQADDDYNTFTGSISNVSLVATVAKPTLQAAAPGGQASVTISGTPGVTYLIQYVDALSGLNNWQSLTNLTIPSSPYTWTDPTTPLASKRFYRAIVVP